MPESLLKKSLFLKKRLWHRCFPVHFGKTFKNTVFYRTPPVAASVIRIIFRRRKITINSNTDKFIHQRYQQYLAVVANGIRQKLYPETTNRKEQA